MVTSYYRIVIVTVPEAVPTLRKPNAMPPMQALPASVLHVTVAVAGMPEYVPGVFGKAVVVAAVQV